MELIVKFPISPRWGLPLNPKEANFANVEQPRKAR